MSEEPIISLRNVSKTYRAYDHPLHGLIARISGGRIGRHKEFHALNDVSFDIHKGETVGIIGRNGSGKSTLLQIICGIRQPTSGSVSVKGRISALLELGSGFQPEFTGRENVFLQGAIIGLTREEMETRFDDIAAFADIGEYIDQPVKTYSSGMYVRLAFAVAISVNPDILVVDEALAVGDAAFQTKCFKRIDAIRKQGGTILLVTHVVEQVAYHCDRALLLDHGDMLADGDTTATLAQYIERLRDESGQAATAEMEPVTCAANADDRFSRHAAYNSGETRWGDRQAAITNMKITQDGREDPKALVPGNVAEIRLSIHFHADIECPIYGMTIKSEDGAILLATNSRQLLGRSETPSQKAGDTVHVCFRFTPFLDSGSYSLSFGVASEGKAGLLPHDRRYDSIILRIASPRSTTGDIEMNPEFRLLGMQ